MKPAAALIAVEKYDQQILFNDLILLFGFVYLKCAVSWQHSDTHTYIYPSINDNKKYSKA